MTTPPRSVESILMSLGATADYRDAVLGDLAEEFASRTDRDGERSARVWYYREAVRAVPHLLGNWARTLRGSELRRLIGIAVSALTLGLISVSVVAAMVKSIVTELGLVTLYRGSLDTSPLGLAIGLAGSAATAAVSGYFTGRFDDRTPLASAFALGAMTATLYAVAVQFGTAPEWYRLVLPVIALVFTPLGGVLWVAYRSRQAGATRGA